MDGGAEVSSASVLFEGDRASLEAFLRSVDGYYVYLLCRPDGIPFYIGKGTKRRALEHELEALRRHPIGESNPIKCNVIRKLHRNGQRLSYKIDSVYDSSGQQDCLEREAALIAQYRRLHEGGCLTNLAGGLGSVAGSAPLSRAKHAATLSGEPTNNPERATLNRFLQAIGPVDSVPVKPLAQMSRVLPTTPHPSPRKPTARCAYALIASASASGLSLILGTRIPRSFSHRGIQAIIENGVARDILKAGMATLEPSADPRGEVFTMSPQQIELTVDLVGRQALADRGLL